MHMAAPCVPMRRPLLPMIAESAVISTSTSPAAQMVKALTCEDRTFADGRPVRRSRSRNSCGPHEEEPEILWLAPGRPCQHQEMTVVQPGQGRPLNPEMTLKVGTHDLPHGSLSVVEGIVAPRQFIGPHTHSREDEVTLVLEGQIVALVDDTVVEVNAGSLLLKPAGVMHAFGNPGPEPARVHELHAPGGLEEFYAAMHLNYSDPHLTGEQKHAAFLESCKEFGLVHHLDLTDEVRRRLDL